VIETLLDKKHILIIRATKNNVKFFIYNTISNKPIYRLTTRNPGVKTKNKISPICLTSMCAHVGSFVKEHNIPFVILQWRGIRKNRRLVLQLVSNYLINTCWITGIDDCSLGAHNGCRGVHLRRK